MEKIYNSLKDKSLLIIEDDVSTLKWLSRVLSLYFHKVYSASCAIEGLEVFKNTNTNIVIADIQMPNVDGLVFLEKIKEINKNTFRIVMTAFNSPLYLNRAVEAGTHLYLKKPIDIDEILVAIASRFSNESSGDIIIDLGESFVLDTSKKLISKNNKRIDLTKKELLLIYLLLNNKNAFVSFELMEQVVWKEHVRADAIRMVIVSLRKKLYPSLIQNLKGLGYRINLP